jgi:flagellar biosynthesis protein FliR
VINLTLLPEFAFAFMLVFARVGIIMMLMPAVGERATPGRVRLSIALFVALLLLPLVRDQLPTTLNNVPQILQLMITEIMIGITFGLAGRFLMSSLQTAGVLIAQQMGLSFTMTVDPTGGDQGQAATLGNFLTLLGITLIFAANLHHVAIAGIVDSYQTLPPGRLPPSGDAAQLLLHVAGSSFALGVQISAPFLVFGLVFNMGLGILSRMMPALQVFFLAMPATILIGTIIMIFVLGLMMDGFIGHVGRMLGELFPGTR